MNNKTPYNPNVLTRHADGIAITSRTTNPIVDAINNIIPAVGSHTGGPFLGQPIMYKLRGWKLPAELAGAWYWGSKVRVGHSILDPTKDVNLIFDWDLETGSGEGSGGLYPSYKEPNLILINPSDILIYDSIALDDTGEPLAEQPINEIYSCRSGHSLCILPDENSYGAETGMPTDEVHFGIAYLVGQATVEGKIYDVAMMQRDDRWFVCQIIGKTDTIGSEEVELSDELYAAKMISRHGKPVNISGTPQDWSPLGTVPTVANCYFRNIETKDSVNTHVIIDDVELGSGETYTPTAIGYLKDFTYDGIPIIAGYCLASMDCTTNDGSGSGG